MELLFRWCHGDPGPYQFSVQLLRGYTGRKNDKGSNTPVLPDFKQCIDNHLFAPKIVRMLANTLNVPISGAPNHSLDLILQRSPQEWHFEAEKNYQ